MAEFDLPTVKSKVIENPRKYELLLNKLAEDGFTNQGALLKNPAAVIAAIKTRVPGTEEKDKHKRRYYLSAINWVLPAAVVKRKTAYWKFWQENLPEKNLATDEKWVPRSQFNPDA
jgi:hypothetical protein